MDYRVNGTTQNYANKRGLDIDIDDVYDDGQPSLYVYELDDDGECPCEHEVSYYANADGSYTYAGRCCATQALVSELPAHIRDEKHLREVLAFIAKNI